MNKLNKRFRRFYKYHKKYNFHLLNKISRILSWLLPGLVIKRWMLTSAIGFLTSLLGLSIWTNLRPLYWLIEIFFSLINVLTSVLPVSLTVPVCLAASCAFMLPVATPPNAIVYGSNKFSIATMMRAGFALNIIGILVVTIFAYYFAPLIF
mgnify:CR=1 FL=1